MHASPCTVSSGSISATVDCETTENSLVQVGVKDSAKLIHTPTGDVTITNPTTINSDFPNWNGHGTYGIRVIGTGTQYQLNSADSKGNITIDVGATGANVAGRAIAVETGAEATIYANSLTINSMGSFTGDWNRNNTLYASGGGILNIYADEIIANIISAKNPNGTIATVGGTINIQGNTGLSITRITNSGGDNSSSGISAEAGGVINLERVDIDVSGSGSSNYLMGIYTRGNGSAVNFLGGDIGTVGSNAGTGIRTFELSNVVAKGYNDGYLTITTSGLDSRGIRATGASSVVLNSDQHANFKTTIHTTGKIADGLNAGRLGTMRSDGSIHRHAGEPGSEDAGSSITTYGETHIITDDATSYGLRLIGDGATIEMLGVAGQNRSSINSKSTAVRFGFGNGYSLNLDGSSAKDRGQTITLENVDIIHGGQTGAFALSNESDFSSFTCRIGFCDKNGNNTWTSGNLIQVGDHSGDVGVQSHLNNNNAAMTVADAVVGGVLNLSNSTATAVSGRDLLNVTYGGGTTKVPDKVSSSFTLNASNNTVLEGSIFTDSTLDKNGNASTLTLNLDNSEWHTIRDSSLSDLNLLNNAQVYIGDQSQEITDANKATLLMDTLSGSGIFHLRTDIKETGVQVTNISDLIKVTGTASGNHGIQIKDNNTGNVNVTGNEIVTVAEIAAGNAQFYLANATGYVDMGAYRYGLDTNTATGDWFLSGTAAPVVPPKPPVIDPPVIEPEPEQELTNTANHSVNIFNINYLLNNAETHTLLQRMGELRESDGLGGVWSRVYGGKFSGFGSKLQGFDFKYTGIQLGVDHLISNEYGRFYIGGMAGYSEGEAKYRVGTGDVKSYHLGLYTTFKHTNGFYVDGLIKYNNMRNKFTTQTGGGYTVNGKGTTKGLSASLELGKRFYFQTKDNGWYIEPQTQVAYAHQGATTVRSSNQLKTRLDSVDSLIGRMSMIVGYKITDGANPIDVYFKTGVAKEFKGKTGYTFNDSGRNEYKLDGTWWDNAIGVNAQFDKKHNLYFDVNYAAGNKFDKTQLNLGYRYEF